MQNNVSKKQILEELLKVIHLTRAGENVQALELDSTEDYVTVLYKNGSTKRVCIECDSGIAMVRDVCKVIN